MKRRRLSDPGVTPSAKRARVDLFAIAHLEPGSPAWWEAVCDLPSFDQEINRVRVRKQQQAKIRSEQHPSNIDFSSLSQQSPSACFFCFDTFPTFEEKQTAPCAHVYHSQCLPIWRVALQQNPDDTSLSLCKSTFCKQDLRDFITTTSSQPRAREPQSSTGQDQGNNTTSATEGISHSLSTVDPRENEQDLTATNGTGQPPLEYFPSPNPADPSSTTLTPEEQKAAVAIELSASASNYVPCASCGKHRADAHQSTGLTTVQLECGHHICFDCLDQRAQLFALGQHGVRSCGAQNADGSVCLTSILPASDFLMQTTYFSGFNLAPGQSDRIVVCTLCQCFQDQPEQWYSPPCLHPHCFFCVEGLFEASQFHDPDEADNEDTKHDCEQCPGSLERLFENLMNEAGDGLVLRPQVYEKPPPNPSPELDKRSKKGQGKKGKGKGSKKPKSSNKQGREASNKAQEQPEEGSDQAVGSHPNKDTDSEYQALSEYKDIPNLARHMKASHDDLDDADKQKIAEGIKQMRHTFRIEIETVAQWQYGKDNEVVNLKTMVAAAGKAWSVLQDFKIDELMTAFRDCRANAAIAAGLPTLETTAQNPGNARASGQNPNSHFDWIISLYASVNKTTFSSRARLLYASVAIAEKIEQRGTGVTVKKIIADVMARENQLRKTPHPQSARQRQVTWERRRRAGARLLPLVKIFGYGVLIVAPPSMEFAKVVRWDVETAHLIVHWLETSTSFKAKQTKSLFKICAENSDPFFKISAGESLPAAVDTISVYMVGKLWRLNPNIKEDTYLSEILKLPNLPAQRVGAYSLDTSDLLSLSGTRWPTLSAVSMLMGTLFRVYSNSIDGTIFPNTPWQMLTPRRFRAGDTPVSDGYLDPAIDKISTKPTVLPVYCESQRSLGLPGTANTPRLNDRSEGVWLLVVLNAHLAPATVFHFVQSGHLAASQLHRLLPSVLRDAMDDQNAIPKNISMGASNITVDNRTPMDQAIAMLTHTTLLLKEESIPTRRLTGHTQRDNYALDLFHAYLCAKFPNDAESFRRLDDASGRGSIRSVFRR